MKRRSGLSFVYAIELATIDDDKIRFQVGGLFFDLPAEASGGSIFRAIK